MTLRYMYNKYWKLLHETHLITIYRDDNEHMEGCSLGEGFIRDAFIHPPVSIMEAVQIHILTNPGIEVESNVIVFILSCLEVDCKPVKEEKSFKHNKQNR